VLLLLLFNNCDLFVYLHYSSETFVRKFHNANIINGPNCKLSFLHAKYIFVIFTCS